MKVLLDMNLSKAWLSVLREAGHEVAHWSDCGAATAPDIEIMNYARTHGFVILTHDLDFGTLAVVHHRHRPQCHSVARRQSDPCRSWQYRAANFGCSPTQSWSRAR